MAKRKKKVPSSKVVPFDSSSPVDSPPPTQVGISRAVSSSDQSIFMAAIQSHIDMSDCESPEEAQAKLDELLTGKSIDEIIAGSNITDTPHFQAIAVLNAIDWEGESSRKVEKQIKKALKIDPHCCDAYLLLANFSIDEEEAYSYLKKGVEVGREKHAELIDTAKENGLGLWGFPEARPFLSVMYELGERYVWDAEVSFAQEIFEELIELNPGDNQGARMMLANVYAIRNDYQSGHKLLEQYEDDAGCWHAYSKAMYYFLEASEDPGFIPKEGVRDPFAKIRVPLFQKANRVLKDAIMKWPWTPGFLIDCRVRSLNDTDYYEMGSPEEAFAYAQSAFIVWARDPIFAIWLITEVSRWMCSPKLRAKVKGHKDLYVELLDLMEVISPEELALEVEKDNGDGQGHRDFSHLVDLSEIAEELASRMLNL